MQRGHSRCTSAGTDAHVYGTVRVRVRHVIDRGRRVQSARHLAPVLVLEGNPTQDCFKKQRGVSIVPRERRGGIGRVKKNNSPERMVITVGGFPLRPSFPFLPPMVGAAGAGGEMPPLPPPPPPSPLPLLPPPLLPLPLLPLLLPPLLPPPLLPLAPGTRALAMPV